MATETHVSLPSLGGGVCVERFDDAMIEVLRNILDPNTDPEAVREIRLTVKIKPTESRSMAGFSVDCVPKLAPPRSVAGQLFIGQRAGVVQATEWNPNQPSLLELEESLENLDRKRQAGGDRG